MALTGNQYKAATALARGDTIQTAADAAGVDRTTVIRWKQTPEFIEAMDKASIEIAQNFTAIAPPTLEDYFADNALEMVQILTTIAREEQNPDTKIKAVEGFRRYMAMFRPGGEPVINLNQLFMEMKSNDTKQA